MDFGDVIGLLGGAASGGIFGLIGSLIGVGTKYLQEKQRQAWEKVKWAHEADLLKLNMQARSQETEQELAIAETEGSWRGLEASHAAARVDAASVHRWVNDIRSLFRPFLTVFLWVVAAAVVYMVTRGLISGYLKETDVAELVRYTVYSVVWSASTATVWWFGDRAMSPPGSKGR
jgi:hypothetical protein